MNSRASDSDGVADAGHADRSSLYGQFSEGVRKWIHRQRWDRLHDVQERAGGPILGGVEDVLIAAPTAGGKTEAAFLPIVSRLAASPPASIGCLCLSPLKALINDQFRRLELLCDAAGVPVQRWHGDVSQSAKKQLLRQPRGVLLITPESLEANFVLRGTEIGRLFADLRYVVVDELHAFLDNERGCQLQSQLARLELVIKRRVPRIGLSATLGDMDLAAGFLRPGGAADVVQVLSRDDAGEVKIDVRGYRSWVVDESVDGDDSDGSSASSSASSSAFSGLDEIARHLFEVLRGRDNLVFANSRARVEALADILRRECEQERVPNEFLPHHGSLSKDLRQHAEELLKDSRRPGNVLATTTLEMGIDVGSVDSVAQVGVPPSVASLRQRLGRSGRRDDAAAILRTYILEVGQPDADAVQDGLRASLFQAVAMVELLLQGWCEPPDDGRLHYSTLVQQLLSLIVQYGGVHADEAHYALCKKGSFRHVDARRFATLLRGLGSKDFITQMQDGTLILGVAGERIVEHYDFYAAFKAVEEFQLRHAGRALGSLPVGRGIQDKQDLIFAGQRWRVVAVDEHKKRIEVVPAKDGSPPLFEGGPVPVHDRVRAEMFELYRARGVPIYLDRGGRELLEEGRAYFAGLALADEPWIEVGDATLVFPWVGDRVLHALELLIGSLGKKVENQGIALRAKGCGPEELRGELAGLLAAGLPEGVELARSVRCLESGKYDAVLPAELLLEDYVARSLDLAGAAAWIGRAGVWTHE